MERKSWAAKRAVVLFRGKVLGGAARAILVAPWISISRSPVAGTTPIWGLHRTAAIPPMPGRDAPPPASREHGR